jgi:hypothetical protein
MIVTGLIEVEEGRLFNTAIVVDRGVLVAHVIESDAIF